ncbi:MAG: DUF4003 family protein [Clostridiales bacterium]|nr:DUF4003 family protein [Clostridiales bacterium]
MDKRVMRDCDIFEHNVKVAGEVYWLDGAYTSTAFAATVNEPVSAEALKRVKKIISRNTGFLSTLGDSSARIVVASSLIKSDDPEGRLTGIKTAYNALKKHFMSSEYLALAAVILYESGLDKDDLARRTREIYELMKKAHRLITSYGDIAACALMAISGKDPAELIEESERCFALLKGEFRSKTDLQMLANTLAVYDIPAEVKCRNIVEIRKLMKAKKLNLGSYNSSAVLAPLAAAAVNNDIVEMVEDIALAERTMSSRKGTGGIFGVGKTLRTMFAASVVSRIYSGDGYGAVNSAASAVAAMIAEEVAITIAICASAAASSAAAASS